MPPREQKRGAPLFRPFFPQRGDQDGYRAVPPASYARRGLLRSAKVSLVSGAPAQGYGLGKEKGPEESTSGPTNQEIFFGALSSGASLGDDPPADAPRVNIQFALKARPKRAPELVERLYFARTRKGTMSKADFEAWSREAEDLRNKALERYSQTDGETEREQIVQKLEEKLNRI